MFLVCGFIISGCSSSAPVEQPTESNPSEATDSAPTLEPPPAETLIPTAIPEPLPCTIVFDSDRDGNREIYTMAPDGSALVNVSNEPGEDVDPAWSPDASQIAFVSNRVNDTEGGQFIYVMNADGSNVRQLTFENESNWPDWSADGNWITYESWGDIFIIKSDGTGQSINLTNTPEQDIQPAWSPDGKNIAWLSGNEGNRNIFLINPNGSNFQQLTSDGKVTYVTWTIDGQIFALWDNPAANCMKCVMNADGSNVKEAGGKGELQQYLPFWTLEGDRVECISGDITTPDEEIYLVGEIFSEMFLNLTNNPAQDRNPDWPANCALNRESPAAVSQTGSGVTEIVIGYAGDDQNQWQRKGDFQKACNELGITCVYGTLPELIAQEVSAVVQNSNNVVVNGLHDDILLARDKGIPVFLLDAESGTDGAYSITIDHSQWAADSFSWVIEKMGKEGQIGYFDLDPFNRYSDVIEGILKKYPGIIVADKRDGEYDTSKIKPEFSLDFVNKFPELKGLWTSYDNTQAIWGLEENGIPYEKWPVVVCEATLDGLITWERVLKNNPGFECIAIANPPGIAYDAVYAAYYLVNGAQIDPTALSGEFGHTLLVDAPVIDAENFQEWLDKAESEQMHFIDQLMTPEEIMEKWFLE